MNDRRVIETQSVELDCDLGNSGRHYRAVQALPFIEKQDTFQRTVCVSIGGTLDSLRARISCQAGVPLSRYRVSGRFRRKDTAIVPEVVGRLRRPMPVALVPDLA